ncbi:hypothetical protein [Yunchengibacter salinarum]|uniref:hypothetical protein n=1 Tax=Yunchengibacter salinarum TaxID=3133399 RepID=UPI0035B63438
MAEAGEKTALEACMETSRAFERSVRTSDYEAGAEHLVTLLEKLEGGVWTLGTHAGKAHEAGEAHATRIASSLTSMLLDPDYGMPTRLFHLLGRFKRTMVQIFETSGYRGTGHLIELGSERDAQGRRRVPGKLLPRILLGLSINALSQDLLNAMFRLNKGVSFTLTLAFLSEQGLFNARAEAMRGKLLAASDHWLDYTPNRYQLNSLGPAYMGCSYALSPEKHDIKRCFNAVVQNWLDQEISDLPDASARRAQLKDRPTVVIVAELYSSFHAMHRCYGQSIASLRERFHTILYLPREGIDDEMRALADEVRPLDFRLSTVADVVKKVADDAPDILYLPSVGMRMSSIVFSNLRLAPIQVMTFGHPATTKAPHVDYAVLADSQLGDPATIDETILLRPDRARHLDRNDANHVKPTVRLKPDVVKIAVPAWSRKVVPAFLDMCEGVRRHSPRPVEFVFFPNSVGALHQALSRRLGTMLDATVLPRKSYADYMSQLADCDIFLSSFPFGATNGILDAASLGLPIVNLQGPEVHSHSDSHLVAKLDQPEWLTTRSVAEYRDAVLRLVADDGLRVQISRNILDGDPKSAFYPQDDSPNTDMCTLLDAIYHLHEEVQKRDRHVWHMDDLVRGLKRYRRMGVSA